MRRGLPSPSPKQRNGPTRRGRFRAATCCPPAEAASRRLRERDCLLRPLGWLWFGTELLRFRDGLRPAAAVGWTRGEVCGRPVQLHGVRRYVRALVREVSGLLGLRDARRGGRRPGLAVPGAAEAAAPARRRGGGRGSANLCGGP